MIVPGADTRTHYTGQRGTYGGSVLMGIFFAAGWSPCIGATLGAILTMGLSQQTVGQAMWLPSGYSLGLGVPFLAMALGLERASGWLKRMRPFQKYFRLASGLFIIAIGILLITNTMSLIAIWAFRNGYFIDSFAVLCSRAHVFHSDPRRVVIVPFSMCAPARPGLSWLSERTHPAKGMTHEKDFPDLPGHEPALMVNGDRDTK